MGLRSRSGAVRPAASGRWLGEMRTLLPVIFVFLVLGQREFGQTILDKAQPMGPREKELLAAVTASAEWKPTDARVVKSYQELADFYSSQGRYAEAEKQYTKRLELAEDALGRANPELIPAVND